MGRAILAAAVLILSVGLAQAGTRADLTGDAVVDFQTTMDMPLMAVGNLGNPDDMWGYGGVGYDYRIGKFEVTAGQYTEFLNAVAATDTYSLYSTAMWTDSFGCKIERTGSSGSYTYSVAADWADRPVNFVSWGDSARFANWLTNGMPTGSQDLTTTEDGSYFLNGATSDEVLLAVMREPDARYVIPADNEWYKAAYHKNDGVTGNYFDYPTSSDTVPSNDLIDPDPGNNACFYQGAIWPDPAGYMVGSPYYRTEAGEFENSVSPYGAFDMGGNISEWNEGTRDPAEGLTRTGRGGDFDLSASYMLQMMDQSTTHPTVETEHVGFRIAEVPEPASAVLLLSGALVVARRRRRR